MKKYLLFLLLIGCTPTINSGTIVQKYYCPAYTTKDMVQIGSIPTDDFTIPIYQTQTVEHPEQWYVTIENEANGKMIKRNVKVSKETFEQFNETDWVEFK